MEELKNVHITGTGTIESGHYNSITVLGVATFPAELTAKSMEVRGIANINAPLVVQDLEVRGIATAGRSLRGGQITLNGILTAKEKLEADSIECNGCLTAHGAVSADMVRIGGVIKAVEVFGDRVEILPRRVDSRSKIEHIECTTLNADFCDFGEIWAQNVTLSATCSVDKLYCDGQMNVVAGCRVGKVIRFGEEVEVSAACTAESEPTPVTADVPDNTPLPDDSKAEEGSASVSVSSLPWKDDGKIRLVAFIGHQLMKVEKAGCRELQFDYEGEAKDVICYGNLDCGYIQGHVKAEGYVECDSVGGNVTADGYVECDSVGGNATADGYVECGDVSGNVTADGYVECGDIGGNVTADGYVECGDVTGDVHAEGDVNCGDVQGSVTSGGHVECGNVGGNVTADGYVECGDVAGDVHAEGDVNME